MLLKFSIFEDREKAEKEQLMMVLCEAMKRAKNSTRMSVESVIVNVLDLD